MNVAVDQSRGQHRSLSIDDGLGACRIQFAETADGGDLSADGDDAIGLQDRSIEISAEQQPDILDDQFVVASGRHRLLFSHGLFPYGDRSIRSILDKTG